MAVNPPSVAAENTSAATRWRPQARRRRGGPDGNEQLTAVTGVVLIILLAVLGVTIVRIGQLTWLHLFLGLALIGPVALKMASTGYRFMRYYMHDPAYRRKGPPETWLRLIAPIVVLSTIGVFLSGVLLLVDGPAGRGPLVLIHKATFFVWLAVTGLHVLGHLPGMATVLRVTSAQRTGVPGHESGGGAGRAIALAGALVGGLVLALVLIPDFAAWTSNSSIFHHHRG
jgi:hypothetical protein